MMKLVTSNMMSHLVCLLAIMGGYYLKMAETVSMSLSNFLSMEKNSVDYSPLLSPRVDEAAKKTFCLVSATKWTLKSLISVIFIAWAAFIFVFPAELVHGLYSKWINLSKGTPFGITGSIFMIFSAPVLIIAFLAIAHLLITGEHQFHGYVIFQKLCYLLQFDMLGTLFLNWVLMAGRRVPSIQGFVYGHFLCLSMDHLGLFLHKGLLFVICMVAGVVIFGGFVVGLWHIWEKRSSMKDRPNNVTIDEIQQTGTLGPKDPSQDNIAKPTIIRYGSRPDFKGMSSSS
ncbi:hypothetical protein VNO77_25433 [Canavalia gladiata]|uniref:Uncharacterized protein n=1 Tax=Canavalia gladiata TaxID=3824 RepID=A0AAN9L853_CANGL